MISEATLASALARGVISSEQLDRLRAMEAARADAAVLEPPDDGQYGEEPQYEEPEEEEGQTDEDSGEVVELPPSALHKDDGEEHQDGSQRPD